MRIVLQSSKRIPIFQASLNLIGWFLIKLLQNGYPDALNIKHYINDKNK